MARTDNLKNYLTDIGNAIRTKNGTTALIPANKYDEEIAKIETGINTSDATALASDILKGKTAYVNDEKITGTMEKGDFINGIIKEAKAQGVVTAGDFVTFINKSAGLNAGTDTLLIDDANSGSLMSAVALSDSKVFIAHSYGAGYKLYGIVCTIWENTIIAGTDTQIIATTNSGFRNSAVALSNNEVFIAHSYGAGYRLYGIVCTISGTTITIGTDTQISSVSDSGDTISAVLLSDNKVFIAHNYTNDILYGIVCTISGTTITKATDTQISSEKDTGVYISIIALSNNKVFIAHRYGSISWQLYGIVCNIVGTTIIAGTDTQISATANSGLHMSVVALSDSKVFIAHSYGSNYKLYGIVCDISRNNNNYRNRYTNKCYSKFRI